MVATMKLNTGAEIPFVGFGTWQAAPGEAGRAVNIAIKSAYKHLDCAPLYWNEKEIGASLAETLKETSIPRSSLFITTKVWSSQHRHVEASLRQSLADLTLLCRFNDPDAANFGKEDRLVHANDWDFTNTWADMERLLATGLCKAIGVANFSTVNLARLLKTAKVVPAVNQTELHPLLPQKKLNVFCNGHGIHQTAFGPLGGKGSTLHSHPVVLEIAERRKASAAQVMLSWGLSRGWSVIPKSVTEERIRSNLLIFELSEEEIGRLNRLAETEGRRLNRPNWGTTVFHDDDECVA